MLTLQTGLQLSETIRISQVSGLETLLQMTEVSPSADSGVGPGIQVCLVP